MTAMLHVTSIALDRTRIARSDSYPFNLTCVRNFSSLRIQQPVTFFVGENGSGKSTLLEAIAVALQLNAEGGSRDHHFSTRASHSDLHAHLLIGRSATRVRDCWFLRAESYYNFASEIERVGGNSYGPIGLHQQSHGESFWSLFMYRFGGHGLYLLDEPEAALSPARQLAFLSRMHQLVQRGSQFIIATHSPIILAYPHATIHTFTDDGLAQQPYADTEHYRLTRDFLNHPARSLRELLRDDPE